MGLLKLGVYYRYLGEEVEIIELATSFKFSVEYINVTQWQATGFAVGIGENVGSITGVISNPVTVQNSTVVERNITSYYEVLTRYYLNPSTRLFKAILKPWNTPITPNVHYIEDWFLDQGYITGYYPQLKNTNFSDPLYKHRKDRFTNEIITRFYDTPQITYWQPVDGTPVWTLHIYQDGNEVFSRTETDKLPIQVFVKDGCPSGTCEVDCGSHVCCYKSNGIADDYYLK